MAHCRCRSHRRILRWLPRSLRDLVATAGARPAKGLDRHCDRVCAGASCWHLSQDGFVERDNTGAKGGPDQKAPKTAEGITNPQGANGGRRGLPQNMSKTAIIEVITSAQPWRIVVAALIAGFCAGYLVRSLMSWRRRERARQRAWAGTATEWAPAPLADASRKTDLSSETQAPRTAQIRRRPTPVRPVPALPPIRLG